MPRVVSNDFAHSQTDDTVFELASTSMPPSKRRRVRFDASVHVEYAEQAVPDTEAARVAKTDIWYSRKEIEKCRNEVVAMLKRLQREGAVLGGSAFTSSFGGSVSFSPPVKDGNDMSFRGVEDLMSKSAFQERKKRKRQVVQKVLKEQARQAALKIVDPEGLGLKSQLASKSSRDLAFNRGSRDAMMAYIY